MRTKGTHADIWNTLLTSWLCERGAKFVLTLGVDKCQEKKSCKDPGLHFCKHLKKMAHARGM